MAKAVRVTLCQRHRHLQLLAVHRRNRVSEKVLVLRRRDALGQPHRCTHRPCRRAGACRRSGCSRSPGRCKVAHRKPGVCFLPTPNWSRPLALCSAVRPHARPANRHRGRLRRRRCRRGRRRRGKFRRRRCHRSRRHCPNSIFANFLKLLRCPRRRSGLNYRMESQQRSACLRRPGPCGTVT